MLQAQALFALGSYSKAATALHSCACGFCHSRLGGGPVVKAADYFASEAEFASLPEDARGPCTRTRQRICSPSSAWLLLRLSQRPALAKRELRTALQLVTGDDELANALLTPLASTAAAPNQEKPRPGLSEDDGPREF